MVVGLEVDDPVACFRSVRQCKQAVLDAGLEIPHWQELPDSPLPQEQDPEPSQPKAGWQQRATEKLEQKFVREEVWPLLTDSTRALLRSQHGPLASAPLTALPTSKATRLEAQPFRVFLCRRLHLPLPLSMRTCRCGRQLDMFGHHRGGIGEKGAFLWRWLLNKCAVQRGPACPLTSLSATWIWLSSTISTDNVWRLRQMGSLLWQGAQLATDTTLVSPLRHDGSGRPRAADHNEAALDDRKERTYLELSGDGGRARLVVLAAEVGGRWSIETANFLVSLAKAKALASPLVLQGKVQQA